MYDRLGTFIVQRRVSVLALVLAIAAGCGWFVPELEFNFSPQQFFKTESDLGEFREEFADTFTREDNLVVVGLEGGDVFRPDALGTLRNTTLEIEQIEGVRRAESIATFGIPRSGDSPGSISVEPLLDQQIRRNHDGSAVPVDRTKADKLRQLAMDEPLVRGRLLSESGDAAALLAWLDEDVQAVSEIRSLTGEIESRLDANPPPDALSYRTGGVPVLRSEIVESLQSEQLFFLPITALVYLIVLALLFRRPSGVVLPVAVVLMAVAGTVAVMVATNSAINIVNNVLPSVIFIIGIADSIHLLTRHAEEHHTGRDSREATRRMVGTTGFACLMTSTTTAIGFLSLLYADTAILQNFGWQAAAGVMLAYFFSLFFLPSAVSFMRPIRREASPGGDDMPPIESALGDAARAILDRPGLAVAGSLAVCALFGWFATSVEIDAKLLEVFHRDHPSYETTHFMEQKFGGFLPMEINVESDREGRFRDPEIYRRLRAFQRDAAAEDAVLSTRSIADFHQSARAALLDDPSAREDMPESSAQIRQLHLLVAGSPEEATGPNQYVTRDFSRARVLLRVGDVGTKRQLELAENIRTHLEEHFGSVSDIDYRITGDAYAASVALKSFILDLFYSLLFAGVVIFTLITLMFRSVRLGLASVIPNATPLLVTLGYMGLQGIGLNSTTVIIFAIGLGLAVDDTIHVVARFQEEKEKADSIRDAVLRTYFGAGRAIILTSLLLALGLLVLLFSDFIPTRRFGELTCVTIAAAIVGDLLLLPPLLYLVHPDD